MRDGLLLLVTLCAAMFLVVAVKDRVRVFRAKRAAERFAEEGSASAGEPDRQAADGESGGMSALPETLEPPSEE